MYKLYKYLNKVVGVYKENLDGSRIVFTFAPDNTDYQTFKSTVLNQQPGGSVIEDGDSFSLNTNPNESVLEDADGVKMTIEQAQEYVRTLP